jgi:hypothetical protein
MLSFFLLHDLPSGGFPNGFPSNILYAFLVSPILATCPADPTPQDFYLLTVPSDVYKSRACSLHNILNHSFILPFLIYLFQNIVLSTLFLSSCKLCSLGVWDPYRTSDKNYCCSYDELQRSWHANRYIICLVNLIAFRPRLNMCSPVVPINPLEPSGYYMYHLL